MKTILSSLLALSLSTGGVAFAAETNSKKHSSGSHRNNRTSSHKSKGNVPASKN
jgi:hypothetical protein